MDEFLPWIKHLYAGLHGQPGGFNLMNSGVREPADLLARLLADQPALEARLAESNEWGHPAVVRALRHRYTLPPDREVQVTAGATAAFWLICRALLAPGDQVLVEAPVYEPLRLVPARLGAAVDFLPRRREAAYQVDPEDVAARGTPQTRLVILTNLHNPSGAALGDDVLRRVAEAARTRNPAALVVVDETFHDFVRGRQQSAARLGPAFVTVNTLTKVYGLGLLRCGWVVAAPEVVGRIRRAWIDAFGIGSRLTEALASLALDRLDEFEARWRAVLAANRPLLQEHLGPLADAGLLRGEVAPPGNVCFPEVVGARDTAGLARQLAAEEAVHVVPGEFFGAPGHVRIGFGGESAVLAEGLRRLARALRRRGAG
jgi:aspartate/methionine/tyrosine aminotransferase